MPNNYPKTRKPTGPRPTAGRPPTIADPVRITITISRADWLWLMDKYQTASEGVRQLISDKR